MVVLEIVIALLPYYYGSDLDSPWYTLYRDMYIRGLGSVFYVVGPIGNPNDLLVEYLTYLLRYSSPIRIIRRTNHTLAS